MIIVWFYTASSDYLVAVPRVYLMYAVHGSSVEVNQSRTSVQNNAVDKMLLRIPRKIYRVFSQWLSIRYHGRRFQINFGK